MLEEFLERSSHSGYIEYVKKNSADLFLAQYVMEPENWKILAPVLIPNELEFGKNSDNIYRVVRELKPIIKEISDIYVNKPTNTSWLTCGEKSNNQKFRLGLIDYDVIGSYDDEHYEKFEYMKRPYRQVPSEKAFDLINQYKQILGQPVLQIEKSMVGAWDPNMSDKKLENQLKLVSNK